MNIKIIPANLSGNIRAISSKSDVHRLLIASAVADNPTEITVTGLSLDMRATIDCLVALGAKIDISSREDNHTITVFPIKNVPPSPVLNCRESGSTARFLLPVASCLCNDFTVLGEGGLPGRPFSPLCTEMERHGCSFTSHSLPMRVRGRLNSGIFRFAGDVSSQYITGLLLALPLICGDSKIELLSPLQSKNYVDMTIDTLNKFDINIAQSPGCFAIYGNHKYISPRQIIADGDWSNAAFWLSCPDVTISGLQNDSLQGDRAIVPLLAQLQSGHDTTIDASQIPDLVPILSAVAAISQGKTAITNASRLRLKESDRLYTVFKTLSDLGVNIKSTDDGLEIIGKPRLNGGTVDSFNDHRIAMTAAIASCACDQPVIITNAQAVNKSYPDFFTHFNDLGGSAHVI